MTEEELEIQENAGIIAVFLSIQFTKHMFDSYMHAYTHSIKEKVYSKEFKATHSSREVALSRKKAKVMINTFNQYNHSATEIAKIFSLNKAISEPFESNSAKLFMDLEKKFKRSLVQYVNSLTGEIVLPGSPEEVMKKHKDLTI